MSLELRPATIDDAQQVFLWRNDSWIVALGSTRQTVSWDEHYAWFRETVAGQDRRMFIILFNGTPIGQVRFDRLEHDTCKISIYLIHDYTGRGLGVIALQQACEEIFCLWNINHILAWIRVDNHS